MPRRSSGENARRDMNANSASEPSPTTKQTAVMMKDAVAFAPDTSLPTATPPWFKASTRPTKANTMAVSCSGSR